MNEHRLAEERSLAYHRAVAGRLRRDPGVLRTARQRLSAWLAEGRMEHYARAWQRVLSAPVDAICEALVADTAGASAATGLAVRGRDRSAGAVADMEIGAAATR